MANVIATYTTGQGRIINLTALTASGVGSTGATSNAGAVKVDLGGAPLPRFVVRAGVVTNATAPGASRSVTVFWAGDNVEYDTGSVAVASLYETAGETSLQVPLANTANNTKVGLSAPQDARGRWLYVWYDITALDAGATLTISVSIYAA